MFTHYTHAHVVHILGHIVGGSIAILAGVVAILSGKGGRLHTRAGMIFLWAYCVVIVTAVLGVVVFEFRSFLAVATIASSYSAFSGYRAVVLRGGRPRPLDLVFGAVGMVAPLLFVAAIQSLHKPWSPVLTWTVLGNLIAMSGYDLLRRYLPATWLQRVWVQEHLIKLIGAFDALTATFAATIFPQYQPWSALIPNLVGTAVMIGFLVVGPRAWRSSPRARRADVALQPLV